jgi:hypothetical protein
MDSVYHKVLPSMHEDVDADIENQKLTAWLFTLSCMIRTYYNISDYIHNSEGAGLLFKEGVIIV